MNEDDRLNQYFHLRAATITVDEPEPTTIAARAGRRRRSRRTLVAVSAAVVVLAGALALFGGGDGTRDVNTAGSNAAHAALKWTKVDVPDGLGWSAGTVSSDDGSIYGLSTAPGATFPTDGSAYEPMPKVLYHSTDGKTWDQLALPDDLSATELATSAGRLYAVGTAPGGGGVDLVVASSADGAGTWTEARIPSPAAALRAQFPTEVRLSAPRITTGPKGVIATVTVIAEPDVAARLHIAPDTMSSGWETTADGVNVFAPTSPDDPCGGGAPTASTSTLDPTAAESRKIECAGKQPTVARSYSWDEVGLEPALQAILGGQVHVYRSDDGTSFDEVDAGGLPSGSVSGLIGDDAGYRMLVNDHDSSALHPLWSTDGRSWTQAGADLDGYVQTVGLLAGTPAAILSRADGATLLTATAGGGWSRSDLLSATGVSSRDGKAGLMDATIGPLGLVAVAYTDGSPGGTLIIDSANGQEFTSHTVDDLAGSDDWNVAGVSMNADAVTVRLLPVPATDGTSKPPGPQRLLVGTPR